MKNPALFPKVFSAMFLAAGVIAATSCNSHNGPRDLMMEEATKQSVERPVAMRGEGTFLDGKVTALATVSRGFDRGVTGGRGRGGRGARGDRPGEGVYDEGRRSRRDDAGAFTEVFITSEVTAIPRRNRRRRCRITFARLGRVAPPAARCRR
jgi:hypothetical protein